MTTAVDSVRPRSGTVEWRERAVNRSLDNARLRAERRVQTFLDAAWELMPEKEGGDFTVQEVVERSGQSLRSFYQYFGGKNELMIALLEESLRRVAVEMQAAAGTADTPLGRLRAALLALHDLSVPDPTCTRQSLANFSYQLLVTAPEQSAALQRPVREVVVSLVRDAVAQGAVLCSDPERAAVLSVHLAKGAAHRAGVFAAEGQAPLEADELWSVLVAVIGVPVVPVRPPAPRRRARSA